MIFTKHDCVIMDTQNTSLLSPLPADRNSMSFHMDCDITALFLLLLWTNVEHVFQESSERREEKKKKKNSTRLTASFIPALRRNSYHSREHGAYLHTPEESNTFYRSCSNPVITPSFAPSYGSDS